jgi:hypothetical protein
MGCSTKSVGRYIASILEVEPQYRNQRLTAEEVEHERQVECARLDMLWQEISDALKVTDSENAAAIARLVESGVRVSERRSRLRGLDAPSRVQEQLLSISYKKVDQKVVIEFDQSQIEAPSEPIPDLSVWHNGQLVALPGDGSKDPEPTDQALLAFEGDHNGSSDAAA